MGSIILSFLTSKILFFFPPKLFEIKRMKYMVNQHPAKREPQSRKKRATILQKRSHNPTKGKPHPKREILTDRKEKYLQTDSEEKKTNYN